MKKNLLLYISLLLSTLVYSQDSGLFENSWFARSITFNGTTTEAPRHPNMEIELMFNATDSFSDMCCGGTLNFDLDYDQNQYFEISAFSPSLETCDETPNNEFRDVYIAFFQEAVMGTFEYEIAELQNNWDYKILTLTNANGDEIQFYDSPHNIDTDPYIFEVFF